MRLMEREGYLMIIALTILPVPPKEIWWMVYGMDVWMLIFILI